MKRPRRLLSIGHSYVVSVNRRLAHEIAKAGGDNWEMTVAAPTYFHGSQDLRPVHLDLSESGPARVIPINAYFTSRIHVFLYGSQLRSLMAENWDLVHCWQEPYILVGGQVAWWMPPRTPLVFCSCQNLNKNYPIPFNWIEKYAINRASGWICIGELVAKNLSSRSGYDKLPMAQIPLGVDLANFRPDPQRGKAVRKGLNWPNDGTPIVGYLGRFVPEKGLNILQSALDQLTTPWRALFVGAGPSEATLRAWADRYGDRVRICTTVTHGEVPSYLNAMDVLCAPSQTTPAWKEQFGRMIVEAFASGLAFIGSDSGEIPSVVGDAGLIVGENDTLGWSQAITELLENVSCRTELAARGLERARQEFAWPVVARRHLDFFESILARK